MKGMSILKRKGKHTSGCISGVYQREGVSRMLHIADNYWAKKSKRGYTVLKEMEKKNED